VDTVSGQASWSGPDAGAALGTLPDVPMSTEPVRVRPPSGTDAVPAYDGGWLIDGEWAAPFLSYVADGAEVNWSDELEQLHEEASRSHFMDVWTRRAMLDRSGIGRNDVVLDLGCSTGYLLEDLARLHPSATLLGLDLVGAGLIKAHEHVPQARLLRADACDVPLADASVDVVLSANLLEHVPDDRGALREIARILRPGRRAAVVVPAGSDTYDYYDRFLGHERRYDRGELAGKGEAAGLRTLEDTYLGSLIYPAFWLVKQRNRRRRGHLRGQELADQVSLDMVATNDSRVGSVTTTLERLMLARGLRLPFGIRNLVVFQRC
jgi:SAM-dependent methyltransferase